MWSVGGTSKKVGVALYAFDASQVPHGLSLDVGDTVHIVEECEGWIRGYTHRNKHVKGIFPSSFIYLRDLTSGCSNTDDRLIIELTHAIRRWARIWKSELFVKDSAVCKPIRQIMLELLAKRKELMGGAIAKERKKEITHFVATKIDWVNKTLRLDFVPRKNHEQVDPNAESPVTLYGLHVPRKSTPTMCVANRGSYIYQLYMQLRSFQCQVGIGDSDDVELYFSLYNVRKSEYICERILCKLNKDGHWADAEQGKNAYFSCLVQDLTGDDSRDDVHIVVHVCRVGSLLLKDGAKKAKQISYRRPVGCGVLGISDVLQGSLNLQEECTHLIRIVQCNNESDFPTLAENIIRKQAVKESKQSSSGASSAIVISLRLLTGDLPSARKNHPLLFTRPLVYAQPLTVQNLGTISDVARNDLYITIIKGEFEKGIKRTAPNIEVKAMLIHRPNGAVKDCVSSAAGDALGADYKSMVFYHNSQPHWGESFRLAVPADALTDMHVRFEFRHCSVDAGEKRLLCFSFLKLADVNGAPIVNGRRELTVYTVADNRRLSDTTCSYLNQPDIAVNPSAEASGSGTLPGSQPFARSPKESFYVETTLCSILVTQCGKLLNLFKWRDHFADLPDVLVQFTKADPIEMLKFYENVFNVLFEMFPAVGQRQEERVFNALIHVLQVVCDDKYCRVLPLCKTYIEKTFSAPLSFRYLLGGLCRLLDRRAWDQCLAIFGEASRNSAKAAENQVLNLLFKIIAQAAVLHKRLSGEEGNLEVLHEVDAFWKSTSSMLALVSKSGKSEETEALRKTQAALLIGLPGILESLLAMQPPKELAESLVSAVASACQDDARRLALPRLHCIKSSVACLFENDDSRRALIGMCSAELKACLLRSQHVATAAETLGDLLSSLYNYRFTGTYAEDVQSLVISLLDVVMATILDTIRTTNNQQMAWVDDDTAPPGGHGMRILGTLIASFVGLLDAMSKDHYEAVFYRLPSREVQRGFTVRILLMLSHLTATSVIRDNWTVMLMVTNRAIIKVTQYVRRTLTENFLTAVHFDGTLWEDFIRLCVKFITQPCLQLETFHDEKAEQILERYQDLRLHMCEILVSVWNELGGWRAFFIPALVRPFLEVSLIPQHSIRQMVLPVFFDMMVCEQKACGNFGKVASGLIDGIDHLINRNQGDSDYLERFRCILMQRTEDDCQLRQHGLKFISSVSDLLERLLDYRKVLQLAEAKETHMLGTLSILDFYEKEIHREELYSAYVYKLADLHLEAKHYTEAALTLMLCGAKLAWSTKDLSADAKFPAQKEWQRKKTLYEQCIKYFEQGESYEQGIPLCKELAEFCERRLCDYTMLSDVLITEARFFSSILTKEEGTRCYFRVGFVGRTFPLFLRNKIFIYRGDVFSRFGSVDRILKTEFPNATMFSPNNQPTDEMKNGSTQYIQLSPVQPLHCELPQFPDAVISVDQRLEDRLRHSCVTRFQYDSAYHIGNRKNEKNEFKSLCINRQTFATAEPLPWVVRWSEVTSVSSDDLNPIQVAIDAVLKKNKELQFTVQEFAASDRNHANVQPLSRQLGGVIDAAVNGGIAKYQEAFFAPDYLKENPSNDRFVEELRQLFLDQVRILHEGLQVHNKLVEEEMRPFHENLEDAFKRMRQSMNAAGSHIDLTDDIAVGGSGITGNFGNAAPLRASDQHATPSSVAAGSPTHPIWLKELGYESVLSNSLQSTIVQSAIGDGKWRQSCRSSGSSSTSSDPPQPDYDSPDRALRSVKSQDPLHILGILASKLIVCTLPGDLRQTDRLAAPTPKEPQSEDVHDRVPPLPPRKKSDGVLVFPDALKKDERHGAEDDGSPVFATPEHTSVLPPKKRSTRVSFSQCQPVHPTHPKRLMSAESPAEAEQETRLAPSLPPKERKASLPMSLERFTVKGGSSNSGDSCVRTNLASRADVIAVDSDEQARCPEAAGVVTIAPQAVPESAPAVLQNTATTAANSATPEGREDKLPCPLPPPERARSPDESAAAIVVGRESPVPQQSHSVNGESPSGHERVAAHVPVARPRPAVRQPSHVSPAVPAKPQPPPVLPKLLPPVPLKSAMTSASTKQAPPVPCKPHPVHVQGPEGRGGDGGNGIVVHDSSGSSS